MAATPSKVGLYYEESVYAERAEVQRPAGIVSPVGPTGRRVAGRGFLDAYLSHGAGDGLVVFVAAAAAGKSAADYCRSHPSAAFKDRRVEVVEEQAFHARVFPEPPAPLIHFPHPPEARYAWARQHGGPGAFALSGVTHGLASAGGAEALRELVTAPFEPYDALVCTSRAAADVVRATAGAYADYLRDRQGGDPGLRPRLEVIPTGVDAEKFGPPSPADRAASRHALGAADDEVVVLSLGRLSHHGKAHPYPLFDGVARAARATGRKVHLVLAGWAVSDAIAKAFRDGARVFAPGVRVSLVDGAGPPHRFGAWHAADIFASFADNIQETFGLAVTEAMASGLPVVASDWDGNRDQVVDGETGFLIPTYMVRGATADATSRLVVREVNYDFFLAECNQAVAVDPAAVAGALGRLIADDDLRRRLGAAGRARVLERFTWPTVIRAYERLWEGQEEERRSAAARRQGGRPHPGPACHPAPEHAYAAYPTALLGDDDRVVADEDARERLTWLLGLPLTNYLAERRSADPEVLRSVLAAAAAPRTLAELDGALAGAGVRPVPGRATLAWMLKYGLLRQASAPPGADRGDGDRTPS